MYKQIHTQLILALIGLTHSKMLGFEISAAFTQVVYSCLS